MANPPHNAAQSAPNINSAFPVTKPFRLPWLQAKPTINPLQKPIPRHSQLLAMPGRL
jgi:hypothetical protein